MTKSVHLKILIKIIIIFKNTSLPGGNITVLDCIEVKYNPTITTKNPIMDIKKQIN